MAIADMHATVAPADVSEAGTTTGAGDADLDSYCRIVRVKGDAPAIFIRGVLQAELILLEELSEGGTSLGEDRLHKLDDAFAAVMSYVAASSSVPPARIAVWNSSPVHSPDPLRRWIRGHHIFVMLTQGLILALHDMEDALIDDRKDNVAAALDMATVLMESSAIAFRFAGDFAPTQYRETVRPTMMPPLAPEGLSGVLSADHRFLLQILNRLKPRLEDVQLSMSDRYSRFVTAFRTAYDDHVHVCSRFVGSKEPSLLMKAGDEKSAVQQLEYFKRLRMKVFE